MPNADKCYLSIPFKQYLMSLADAIDDEGNIDPQALKLAGRREFENYKAIERRVNDAACAGACACVAWKGHSYRDVAGSDTVSLAAGVFAANDIGYWTATDDRGGITAPSGATAPFVVAAAGLYHVDAAINYSVTGTDPAQAGLIILQQPSFSGNAGWGNFNYLIPSITAGFASASATFDLAAGEGFLVTAILQAAAASTRSITFTNIAGFGGIQLAVHKICGCD